jgi:phospholipid transport system transporter-binding protein
VKIEATCFTNANASALVAQGLQALRAGQTRFDLSAVREVDSAAVATLLAWRRAAQQLGVTLELTGLPSAVCSLATLYGVDGLLGTPHQESIVGPGHDGQRGSSVQPSG